MLQSNAAAVSFYLLLVLAATFGVPALPRKALKPRLRSRKAPPPAPIGVKRVKPLSSLIIGGGDAAPNEYPFAAMIMYWGDFVCGGTLHNALTVITAKHCVDYAPATYFTIKLGVHRRSQIDGKKVQEIAVKEIKLHPTLDIALVILEKLPTISATVNVTGGLVQNTPQNGHPATAVGWGWVTHGGGAQSAADTLQELTLPLTSNAACDGEGLATTSNEICAGYSAGNYINVCHGDSGGPLVIRETPGGPWKLLGVVSRGHDGCPENMRFAVYISVPSIRQWILDNDADVCFPGSALVETPLGSMKMSAVKVGDLIMTVQPDGKTDYQPVISFLHREPARDSHYITLSTAGSGNITLSPKHLIFRASKASGKFHASTAVFASRVQTGDKVFVSTFHGLKAARVTSVSDGTDTGVYAPLTSNGNVVVDRVVASCYASFEHHGLAHLTFVPFRWYLSAKAWWEATPIEKHQQCEKDQCTATSNDYGIHWYPRILMILFSSLY